MRVLYNITVEDERRLANEVKNFRESRDISQHEMAILLDVSRATYNRKERGETPFHFLELFLMARTFGVRLSTIAPSFVS